MCGVVYDECNKREIRRRNAWFTIELQILKNALHFDWVEEICEANEYTGCNEMKK